MSDNEMLKLADEIEYAIRTEDYVTLFSGGASLVVTALRAAPDAEIVATDEMVEAAARELWNDRDARMGGSWDSRDPQEVCVIQTRATARAMLDAALTKANGVRS